METCSQPLSDEKDGAFVVPVVFQYSLMSVSCAGNTLKKTLAAERAATASISFFFFRDLRRTREHATCYTASIIHKKLRSTEYYYCCAWW